jgi:flagellar basal-body rod modification protein FlgD
MATSVNGVSSAGGGQAEAGVQAGGQIVGKDDFLKLLVAQIRNQNPLNPADGVEFLSQLAQFSQLEQLINIRTQLDTLIANREKTSESGKVSEAS